MFILKLYMYFSYRQVALKTFRHLHALSLRFHLERQTGGMTRDIERGTRALQSLARQIRHLTRAATDVLAEQAEPGFEQRSTALPATQDHETVTSHHA